MTGVPRLGGIDTDQLTHQEGVECPGHQLALCRPLVSPRDLVQEPSQLGSRVVWRERQTGATGDLGTVLRADVPATGTQEVDLEHQIDRRMVELPQKRTNPFDDARVISDHECVGGVNLPYVGGEATKNFTQCNNPEVITHNIPIRTAPLCTPIT